MTQRISTSPVWQILDENNVDVIASLNVDGSVTVPQVAAGTANTNPGVATPSLIARVLLTSAQLLALKTTPIQLLPNPGANQVIYVEEITLRYLFLTAAYTLNAGTFKLFLGAVANAKAISADQSAILTAVANGSVIGITGLPAGSAATPLTDAQALGQSVFAGNDGAANYTVGAGTLEVVLTYAIVNV